jgi:methylenetetrahydrofolate reductase (NADPH)
LLDEGVPALHFYTMNRAKATREVLGRLGLVARA